jgi:CO dehydrogenase/acetyl-CoA synthase beta subunit
LILSLKIEVNHWPPYMWGQVSGNRSSLPSSPGRQIASSEWVKRVEGIYVSVNELVGKLTAEGFRQQIMHRALVRSHSGSSSYFNFRSSGLYKVQWFENG